MGLISLQYLGRIETSCRVSRRRPSSIGKYQSVNQPLQIWQHTLPNRLAIQPMEGCDGEVDGSPGELTFRRYRRFAESGGALIWEEATAIVPEGRANPRQLMLTEKNLDSFRRLTDEIREYSQRKNGFAPLLILQATHSGRYSKPQGTPAPLIAYHNPIFEKKCRLMTPGLSATII